MAALAAYQTESAIHMVEKAASLIDSGVMYTNSTAYMAEKAADMAEAVAYASGSPVPCQ